MELSMSPEFARLQSAVAARTAVVAILGLGDSGIRRAHAVAKSGFRVIGFDTDGGNLHRLQRDARTDQLESYIQDLRLHGFESTDRSERLDGADILLICLSAALTATRSPDATAIASMAQMIATRQRSGQLIVFEGTGYPGLTRQVIQPILEKRGLRVGTDFLLAHGADRAGPELRQVDDTNSMPPCVISGIDAQSLELASEFYKAAAIPFIKSSSVEVAEAGTFDRRISKRACSNRE